MTNDEEQLNEEAFEEQAAEYLDYEDIIEEYRRRQMIEHLTGPMISLVVHVVVIALCAIFLAGREIAAAPAEIEFEVKEVDIKPVDEEVVDELDELDEEMIDDTVPTVEKPEITPETADAVNTEDFAEAMANSEMDLDFTADLDVRPTRSPRVLRGMYGGRSTRARQEAIREHGGRYGGAAEAAVIKALEWLKNNQNPDGSWSKSKPHAMTALGILTFLAHNETPSSERYGVTVQKAIQWLVQNYDKLGVNKAHHGAYSNGIVAYALSEAYIMTGKAPAIKPAVEKSLNNLVQGQQPDGGFDYGYKKGDRWDLSVGAWQMQALKAGYNTGLDIPGIQEAIEKAIDWTKNTTFKNGKFGYSSPGSGRLSITAAGALAMQLLGEGKSSEVKAAMDTLEDLRPKWEPDQFALASAYGWYYATQAKFHEGRRQFRPWNADFVPVLVKNQHQDGHWDGPVGKDKKDHAAGSEYEPYYNTTLNALSLMVYYRYLPTYKEPEQRQQEDEGDIFSLDDEDLAL